VHGGWPLRETLYAGARRTLEKLTTVDDYKPVVE